MPIEPRIARRVSIRGIVQGVGFRPFVYRAAVEHQVFGWVLNGDAGVEIHVEGAADAVEAFVDRLRQGTPPAAKVAEFEVRAAQPEGLSDFCIRASRHETAPTVRMSPDLALCADCRHELRDPANRRFGYPYINCTNCGPRYSIIQRLPYDRAGTTMAAWAMCDRCRREYADPLDRRYHAQPIACADCGPGYRLIYGDEHVDSSQRAICRAVGLLSDGKIVAIKGIGGYHLACDATNRSAVAALRTRKFRKEKPFAVMAATLDDARGLVELSAAHEALLLEVTRPIVLAPARRELPDVAPDNASLGVMLPYTPLHELLFGAGVPRLLVLTSANRSSEPIAYRDDDALSQLSGIADAFLIGERPIARRVDDSVVAVRKGRPMMMRRSRGYAPAAVCRLPAGPPILAVGADFKNAVALVVDGQALVSQHIGDLDDYASYVAFEETVRNLLAMYDVEPTALTVAHDLHPQFRSTRFAASLPAARHVAVQHHHAHIASVMAEHDLLDEPVVGVALDGTGYGIDGTIWGGEFLVGSVRAGFERRAWLRPVPMPGGDAAARFPLQAAAGFLANLAGAPGLDALGDLPDMSQPPFSFSRRFFDALALARKNVRCFPSSSFGRLFDAVAALLGFTRPPTFEGQAAIWLEHQARQSQPQAPYPFPDLDHRPMMSAIVHDRRGGRAPVEIAAAFHATLAGAIVEKIGELCRQRQIGTAALSGGVFQNELLLTAILDSTGQLPGIRLLVNERVPVNDGGICLGQAAVATVANQRSN
ncbi:MAG TPA: carbamoyltransferase HypF [Pirellulales bacterium]|nr:carbamoyltransferase HypF [Pirellulales bacterium]